MLSLVIATALSCRAQSTAEDGTRAAATQEPGTVATETIVVASKETVQVVTTSTPTSIPDGGTVRRATFVDAQTANPVWAADAGSLALCELMFEGLLRKDPFTGEWLPNLAQSWEIAEGGTTYTFTLRHDLFWSDGHPITTRDMDFTYRALRSVEVDSPNRAHVAHIERIDVLDDYTVEVTFSEPGCTHLDAMRFGWLPMHVFTEDAETYPWQEMVHHEFNNSPTVVSGPFILQDWVRGEGWVLTRNDRYWRGQPHLEGIVTQVVSGQDEMVELLAEGLLDIGSRLDPFYLAEVEASPDLRIWKFLSDEYDLLGFQMGDPTQPRARLSKNGQLDTQHGKHPALSDRRVRQAIVHALDRQELVDKVRHGEAILLHANVLPTISWAYNTSLEPRAHDLAEANRLLDEAGWPRNAVTGVRARDGRPLRLKLYTNAGNAVRAQMATLIHEQLAEVGVEIDVIALDWYAFLDVLYGQTFDLVLVNWANLGTDPDDRHLWLAEHDLPGQGSNFVSYYNPDVEDLFEQVSEVPDCDQDARAELYNLVQAELYEDQPYCWLDVPRRLLVISDRVGGVNPGPWNLWYNVHEWYVEQ